MAQLHKSFLRSHFFENHSYLELGNSKDGYDFERIDVRWWQDTVFDYRSLAFIAGGAYLILIFSLEHYMKSRKAFDLRLPLVWWNAALGVFSILGFARTAPPMLKYFTGFHQFHTSICTQEATDVRLAFWGLAFAISKFIELGDTVFIVLRKRPLQMLQWYHHIVTLILVWVTIPYAEPVGRWCILMNYAVHSFMYPYFALKMADVNIPKSIANVITTAQFAQMIIGFLLNASTIALHGAGSSCYRTSGSILAYSIVYGSFIILFGKLFSNSVLKTSNSSGSSLQKRPKPKTL